MSVLTAMGYAPIPVSILTVIIIVSVPLDIYFNLMITIVQVNSLIGSVQFNYKLVYQ